MKVMLTTNRGLEDITAIEIKEILNKESQIRPFGILGRVMFDVKDIEEAIYFTYLTKTANRSIIFLSHFKVSRDKKGLEEIYSNLKSMDWDFLKEYQTFAIRTERFGIHEYTSLDIMKVAGQAVIDSIMEKKKYRQKVNLENPDVIIKVDVIGEDVLVGIDLVGEKSLHKRGYKLYNHPAALKTTLAQQLIILSGWEPNKVLSDPMCGSGTIPIEAGLRVKNIPGGFWRKKDLQFTKLDIGIDWVEYLRRIDEKVIKKKVEAKIIASDKLLKNIKGSEYNAQKALVRDLIMFRRIDLEWLDLKIGEGEIDYIITNPPYGKKLSYYEEVEKIMKYLFYQAKHVLSDNGKLVVITPHKDLVLNNSKKYNFSIEHERKVWNGNLEVFVFILNKT